jgi:hypothetical protein
MIKLLQLILKFERNIYTVVMQIKLNLSDSFEVLIHNTDITKYLSIISEMQREQIRKYNKSDFFPSLLLQTYPSGVCPYMYLHFCYSKIYHRLPSQKHVKCSLFFLLFQCVRKQASEVQCRVLPR